MKIDYSRTKPALHEDDIPIHIEALIEFLGRADLEKSLKRYTQGKLTNKKNKIYDYYYFSQRHPWFETLIDYSRLKERKGKYAAPQLDSRLQRLAMDSLTMNTVFQYTSIPPATLNQYRQNFLSDDNAYPYLFELKTALHYLQGGAELEWIETSGKTAEFVVKRTDFRFQVECKYMTFEKGKNFRRRDFFQLADFAIPAVSRLGLIGEIHIDSAMLPSDANALKKLSRELVEAVKTGVTPVSISNGAVHLNFNLRPKSNLILDERSYYASLGAPPDSVVAVWGPTNRLQDPVALSFLCTRPVRIVDALLDLMKDARAQFNDDAPGVIHIFFEGLKQGGLEKMNNIEGFLGFNKFFFDSKNSQNVVAICYASGPFSNSTFYGEDLRMDGLVFVNPNCARQPPEGFKFIGARSE